jgi:putative colanic acid biosynthesis UDP-glucose lipid carrier transferase
VDYDLAYLKHWSLGFDLRIIALTLWSGLFGTNAY